MSTIAVKQPRSLSPAATNGYHKADDVPQSCAESEMASLSALLTLGDAAPDELVNGLTGDDFLDEHVGMFWDIATDAKRNGYPLDDLKALAPTLRAAGERPGAKANYSQLVAIFKACADDDTRGAHWPHYLKEVRRAAGARRALLEFAKARHEIVNGESLESVLSRCTANLKSIAHRQMAGGPALGPILINLSDVEDEPEEYLWEPRVPIGVITTVCGFGGEGKSFLSCAIATSVSRGFPFIDGKPCPLGSVIVLAGEDKPRQLQKRYYANGADMSKIKLLKAQRTYVKGGITEVAITLRDIEVIREALDQVPDCKLLIIDPIGDFIPGVNSDKDNEVRSLLSPLAALAEEKRIAVLMICHRKKSSGDRADNMALGSVAFTAKARSVLHVMKDPADTTSPKGHERRLVMPGKLNDGPTLPGRAFWIRDHGGVGVIEWDPNPVEMSTDEVMQLASAQSRADKGPDAEARHEAEKWLKDALKHGPRAQKELEADAKDSEGISLRTLKRAKARINVESYRTTIPGPWMWRLPSKTPEGGTEWTP